jgi:hypothetical protein
MSRILGLISSKEFSDRGFQGQNDRRKVFYNYPNGGAPLIGLLSLMEDEATDQPEFGWHETRHEAVKTQLNFSTTVPPFRDAGTNDTAGTPLTAAAGQEYRILVDSTDGFLAGQTIQIMNLPATGGGYEDMNAIITSVSGATTLEIQLNAPFVSVINTVNLITGGTAGPVDAEVCVDGFSAPEGATSATSVYSPPVLVSNYTQIFRKGFSFTGTALKNPLTFDKTGPYRDRAKQACIDHMVEMELACFTGTKRVKSVVDLDGDTVPQRTMGGLMYFLKEYEKADSVYRGGTGAAALTANTDDDKRIIRLGQAGTMTKANWDTYMERLFRVTNNKASEKLCLCGSGHLMAINNLVEAKVVINKNMGAESTYGMNVTTIETPWGLVHFKTHPLFSQRSSFRNSGWYLDIQNIKYRPMNDRDTTLRKLVQANGADRRKDEWLTEMGLEVRYPESHMVIDNLKSITVS